MEKLIKIENFIAKKRNILLHIVLTYFTIGIWLIIYFYCKYKKTDRELEKANKVIKDLKKNLKKSDSITKENNWEIFYNEYTESIRNINRSNEIKSYIQNKSLYQQTRINKFVDDYIVFDLETTGFNSKDDEIIEIGALKYKNNKLIDTFDILINPHRELPTKITKLTKITDDMLKDCQSIEEVLPKFIDFIENYTLIAHNGSFDLGFIEENIKRLNIPMIDNKNIDTLYLARENIPEVPNHKLVTLKEYFNLNYQSHRSLEDCYSTQYIYNYCKEKNTITI